MKNLVINSADINQDSTIAEDFILKNFSESLNFSLAAEDENALITITAKSLKEALIISTSVGHQSGIGAVLSAEVEGVIEEKSTLTYSRPDVHTGTGNINIVLKSANTNKLGVIKQIKDIYGIGLKEAKDIVDNVPSVISFAITDSEAKIIKSRLVGAGASVELIYD